MHHRQERLRPYQPHKKETTIEILMTELTLLNILATEELNIYEYNSL